MHNPDPDRQSADDYCIGPLVIREPGCAPYEYLSWLLEDRSEALTLLKRGDEWLLRIEDYTGDE